MAETLFREADPEFGEVSFGNLVRKYGPTYGLAGYLEEVTKEAPDAPVMAANDFLNKYLTTLFA